MSNGDKELVLLGYFFDYRIPKRTNKDILNLLLGCNSFAELLDEVDECSGRFVLIFKTELELKLIHDAGGQHEVYFDTTFSVFGSQPKLIEKVIIGEELTDPDSLEFYQSADFFKLKTFVGDSTHRANIKHLLPNHFIDIRGKSVHRFFPLIPIKKSTIREVVPKAIEMLQGFIKAAALRYPVELGVTSGYDSRILFLASRDLTFERYVNRNKEPDNPIDVKYAILLGKAHGISIEVRERGGEIDDAREIYEASINFPRFRQLRIRPSSRMIINGHLSEIARNFFGYKKNVTGVDFTQMYLFHGSPYAAGVFDSWINTHKSLCE